MISLYPLLAKLFIKNHQNTTSPQVQFNYIRLQSYLSIFFNFIFAVTKFFFGFAYNSISLMSDAIDSFSNIVSSIIVLVSYRLFNQKESSKYPFGKGRILYITNIIIALFLAITAFELFKFSLKNLFIIQKWPQFNNQIILVLVVSSLLTNEWLARFCFYISKKINSQVMHNEGIHRRSDNLLSLVVLIAWVASFYHLVWIDSAGGLFFSFILMKNAARMFKDSTNDLLGQKPDEKELDLILEIAQRDPRVLDIHEIIIHNYGNIKIMSFHIEMDANLNLKEAHDICDNLENEIHRETHFFAISHPDPVELNNPALDGVTLFLNEEIKANENLNAYISNIRHIRFTNDRTDSLTFDVFCKISLQENLETEIINLLSKLIKENFSFIEEVTPKLRPLFSGRL